MAKDSLRITAGELQKIVESRGQKTLKQTNSTYISTCCLGGFLLAHPKTNSSIFSYQTRMELQMGPALASMLR